MGRQGYADVTYIENTRVVVVVVVEEEKVPWVRAHYLVYTRDGIRKKLGQVSSGTSKGHCVIPAFLRGCWSGPRCLTSQSS